MSSGAIVVAPAVVVAAAAAAAVVAAGAAVVLTARAANAAAAAAVRGVDAAGRWVDEQDRRQSEATVGELVWTEVAADVVELNARIRMLAETAAKNGIAAAVPQRLTLAGCSAAGAARWVAQTRPALAQAQAAVREAGMAQETQALTALLPGTVLTRAEAAQQLTGYRRALKARYERPAGPAAAGVAVGSGPAPGVGATEVEAVLRGLDPDATGREQAEVLAAAAYVDQPDQADARTYLWALRNRVAAVGAAATGRRLAAQWLSALEDPAVAAVEPPGPLSGAAERLLAVVRGEADMTPETRALGAQAADWAEGTAQAQFVREKVVACLAARGYTVQDGFAVGHVPGGRSAAGNSAAVRLTQPDWQNEHAIEVLVDRDAVVHSRLVREHGVEGDDAVIREQTRCADLTADLAQLDLDGVTVVVDAVYEPQVVRADKTVTPVHATLKTRRHNG